MIDELKAFWVKLKNIISPQVKIDLEAFLSDPNTLNVATADIQLALKSANINIDDSVVRTVIMLIITYITSKH